jgi:tRNA pseudouridine(38-40) synthase
MERFYYLIKVFYLGTRYYGLARQPNLRTVEGEISQCLEKKGYILPSSSENFHPIHIASRTDKGVHARGAVMGIISGKNSFHPMEINSILPDDIKIWAFSSIERKSGGKSSERGFTVNIKSQNSSNLFNPRLDASYRHYKYFYVKESEILDLKKIRKAAEKFVGTHDFYNLCKFEINRKTIRTIDEIKISEKNGVIVFNFIAKSFLWKQIRKMVDVLLKIGRNIWSLDTIDQLLIFKEAKLANKIKPVNPDGLILWDTAYPSTIKFQICKRSLSYIDEILNRMVENFITKLSLLKTLKNSFKQN